MALTAQQLFGSFDPESARKTLQLEEEKNMLAVAQLTPEQRRSLYAQQAGAGVGNIVTSLFGAPVQDPRLQQAQMAQEAYQEALNVSGGDASSPAFFTSFANSAARRNLPTLAQQAANQAATLQSEIDQAFQRRASGTSSLATAMRERTVTPLDQARNIVLQLSNRTDLNPQEKLALENAKEVLKLNSPSNVINMTQEGRFAGTRGETQAKALDLAGASAATARTSLTTLDEMERLAKTGGLYTGPLAMTALGASNFLNSIGLLGSAQVRILANAEQYDKSAKDLVMQELGGKLGAQISNTDREFIEARIPQLKNSPTARLEIIQKLKEIQNGKINLYQRMNEHANKYNNLNTFDFSQNYMPPAIIAPQGQGTRENPIKLK
jgi:hypothetical protein